MSDQIYIQKIANLLRTSEAILIDLERKMEKISGKTGVLQKIYEENQRLIARKLREMEISQPNAQEIFEILMSKVAKFDQALYEHFCRQDQPAAMNVCNVGLGTTERFGSLVKFITGLMPEEKGFFLSAKKAQELLRLNPPQNIIKFLNYRNIDELLTNEDVLEVFSALRFAEDKDWLNDVFFSPYNDLKEADFEERKIQVRLLPDRWLKISTHFAGKKLHNISHLKELGIIFVVPFGETFVGQNIELLTLVMHYFYEVSFYAEIFRNYAKQENFGAKMIEAIKSGAGENPPQNGEEMNWRIIQSYLAKDNIDDPRLAQPHVNPEAVHWVKAEKTITHLSQKYTSLDLKFWDGLDWVGDFLPIGGGQVGEILVSFDLIDSVISLTKKTTVMSKYLYHQQEALWNKIFIDYMGEEALEKMLRENLDKGYISLK